MSYASNIWEKKGILSRGNLPVRQRLTLRIQVCVYALCEVQTGSGPECLQTRRPCQMIRGESRLGCHLEPERQGKLKSIG